MKHTPGPWTIGNALNDGSLPIVAEEYRVATASLIVSSKRSEAWRADDTERDANARLIAAAPDLLAALQMLVSWKDYKDGHGSDGAYQSGKRAAWADARAAIAKATGEP